MLRCSAQPAKLGMNDRSMCGRASSLIEKLIGTRDHAVKNVSGNKTARRILYRRKSFQAHDHRVASPGALRAMHQFGRVIQSVAAWRLLFWNRPCKAGLETQIVPIPNASVTKLRASTGWN